MPASMIVSYFALTGVAAAAVTLGVRLVTTYVVSSVIARRQIKAAQAAGGTAQLGTRIQLPPSTDNKIPVVYGTAYMKPIIVDAKISEDNQTMWQVLVFSEAMDSDTVGTFSFDELYWADKRLNFDPNDATRVISWTDPNGETDTKIGGLIDFYLYRNGSSVPVNTTQTAQQVLSAAEIKESERWDSTKKMTGLVFAIVRVKYDQEKGITGLSEITAKITNTLSNPGLVIRDYFSNSRYGVGLSPDRLDLDSLTALTAYSNETISYTPIGGGPAQTSPRYRINGPVDTTRNFFDTILDLTESCDAWLQWNEVENRWAIIPNRSHYDLDPTGAAIRTVTASNIIGGIDIQPIDLNDTYNSVEVQYPNTRARDQTGYYTLNIDSFPNITRSPNEPDNLLTVALPYTNNVVQAQYIGARRLLNSREDLTINFTMDYSGIQIDAGDVIGITHERYGWDFETFPRGKLFRVIQVSESKATDGSLYARITAVEYNDNVYDDDNLDLLDFDVELNTGMRDPSIVPQLAAPQVTDASPNGSNPAFVVQATIPAVGIVTAVEFWYSTDPNLSENNYTLYGTMLSNSGNVYGAGAVVRMPVTALPEATYYWRVRAVGTRTKGLFSAASSGFNWIPVIIGDLVGNNFEGYFTPSISGVRQDSSGTIFYSTAIPRLYGQSGGGKIPFVLAANDSDPAFVANSFRIGGTANTAYEDIELVGMTINTTPVDQGDYAQFSSPTSIDTATNVSRMTVPLRYKNKLGEVYQAIPAVQEINIVRDGEPGQNGGTGTPGFVPIAYIPIAINPSAATQAQLTAAWTAAIGRAPIELDGGTFSGPTEDIFYSFKNGVWDEAEFFISGDIVADGSIRASKLIATDVYAINYQSTNATLNDFNSPGTWIAANTGNARFGGTVNIGGNLTVGGLISNSDLNNKIVGREKLKDGVIPGTFANGYLPDTVTGGTNAFDESIGYLGSFPNPQFYYNIKYAGYYKFLVPEYIFTGTTDPRYKVDISFDLNAIFGDRDFEYIMFVNGVNTTDATYSEDYSNSIDARNFKTPATPTSFTGRYVDTFLVSIPRAWLKQDDYNHVFIGFYAKSAAPNPTGVSFSATNISFLFATDYV